MAAALTDGETKICNAACEPEVRDLANCLIAMGANIEGVGTNTLKVIGVSELYGTSHEVIPDRIESGTYAVAAAMTGGDIILNRTRIGLFDSVVDILSRAGVEIFEEDKGVRVRRTGMILKGTDVMTKPYPGFPTDMQAQLMALLAVAEGTSMITETIFENRFMHVPELCRMGADINVNGSSALVRGVRSLSGAQLMATDLRASVSLVLAGLAAEGETAMRRERIRGHPRRKRLKMPLPGAFCSASAARSACSCADRPPMAGKISSSTAATAPRTPLPP